MTLGQKAYEAYYKFSNGKSLISGADLPLWEDQAPMIQVAWQNAAYAVLDPGKTQDGE